MTNNKSNCNDNGDRINNRNQISSVDIIIKDGKKFSQFNQNDHDKKMDENCRQQYQSTQHVASSSSSTSINNHNTSLSLSHQMIKIEIQDLKLTLPQVNLFTANCGDRDCTQTNTFHHHHHHHNH